MGFTSARRKGEPGRIRIRLAEMLEAKGFTVSPYDLVAAEGDYRVHKEHWDNARWNGYGTQPDGSRVTFFSWNIMTDCVRQGIELSQDEPWSYEVHAKEKRR